MIVVICPECNRCDSYETSNYTVEPGIGMKQIRPRCRGCGERLVVLYDPDDGNVNLTQVE